MNPVLTNILTRRSVRAFSDKAIPEAELDHIIKAALYAPSGMNRQTWQFTVVKNQETIQALADLISKELGREHYDMYRPKVLIIPSNEASSKHGPEDNACAMENIFLAAWSYGIGSVWINQLRDICQHTPVRAFLRELGIPDDHVVYGMAALGYPAQPVTDQTPEKHGKVVIVE